MKPYTVIKMPSLIVTGPSCRTSNKSHAAPIDIPRLWNAFKKEESYGKIPNKASDAIVALYCDYEVDFTTPYTFILGCQTTSMNDMPHGMVGKKLPAATYAVFRAANDPQSVYETWLWIWQSDLKRTYTGDFDLYKDPFAKGAAPDVEVYVAIEANHK